MKFLIIIIFSIFVSFSDPIMIFAETDNTKNDFQHGTIEWIDRCVMEGYTATVRVSDADMNKDPKRIQIFDIEIWSDSDRIEKNLTVTETGNDTGVFEGLVFFRTLDDSSGHRVRAFDGDTVYAKYVDETLPNQTFEEEKMATFVMSDLRVIDWLNHVPTKLLYDPCTIEFLEKNNEKADPFEIFYPSPLKQLKSGLFSDEIRCKDNLKLVFKNMDETPACVKFETIPKLTERGWMSVVTGNNMVLQLKSNNILENNKQILIDQSTSRDICWALALECDYDDKSSTLFTGEMQDDDIIVSLHHKGRGQNYTIYLDADYIETRNGNPIKNIDVATNNMTVDYSVDNNGKVDLEKTPIPLNEKYDRIDYSRLGQLVAETDLKHKLSQKNIEYAEDDYIFTPGFSHDSFPPHTGYCAFVNASDGEDYWYTGGFHQDTLTSSKVHDENPHPCGPNEFSCTCFLSKQLAIENMETLSYFDTSEEKSVGQALQKYLVKTYVANVSNQFIVGKYNFDFGSDITSFCGKFVGKTTHVEFEGTIQDSKVSSFMLSYSPELCAISEDATTFDFTYLGKR